MAEHEPRDEESRPLRPRSSADRSRGGQAGRKPVGPRDGERKPAAKREGDRKPHAARNGERKSFPPREGDRKPYAKRDGDRTSYPPRDGERKPYAKRDGDRKAYAPRDGASRGGPRPTRGGADRPDRATRPEEIRSIRPRHEEPLIPDDVTPQDLNGGARNELKTLSKENAEGVARHLAMAARLIDDDPELAHRHALSASRRAGRIGIVRETLAITAYATGDYALALRELRTFRRISGRDDQIALMVDSERGVGRPDRALEVGRSVDRSALPVDVRVELAIAMSGARLDLGEPDRALLELEIPELDPHRAFEWSPGLFAARAAVLEELGRAEEAEQWHRRAVIAADALDAASGVDDLETVLVEEIVEEEDELGSDEIGVVEAVPAMDPDDVVSNESDAAASDIVDEPVPGADPSVEDEVSEILADAGIDDDDSRS